MNKIAIIIPYFGQWPEWINFFLHSCIHNPEIDWIFPNNCGPVEVAGKNLKFISYDLEDFNRDASDIIGMDIRIKHAYKLCDFKPAYGDVFQILIDKYEFWGYGDLDLIYGNIRNYYTDHMLQQFDVFSNHEDFITGHLCLLRNNQELRTLYKTEGIFQDAFLNENYIGFDEQIKKNPINPDPRFLDQSCPLL